MNFERIKKQLENNYNRFVSGKDSSKEYERRNQVAWNCYMKWAMN